MNLPKVSIVLTTYRPQSKPYLDLCIESIRNLNYPKDRLDVILVGKPGYVPQYDGVRSMTPDIPEFHNPVGVNFGMKHAHDDSDYVFLANDDVIFTRDSLLNMVQSAPNDNCVLGALSNCDNYWIYIMKIGFEKEGQQFILNKRYYSYDELAPFKADLMNSSSYYHPGLLVQPYLCMYANLIPKKLWDKLGGFDEGFGTGGDDVDFCMRAKNENALIAIATSAVILHFGGASTNHTLTPEMREETQRYFHRKWGFRCDGKPAQ